MAGSSLFYYLCNTPVDCPGATLVKSPMKLFYLFSMLLVIPGTCGVMMLTLMDYVMDDMYLCPFVVLLVMCAMI